MNGPASKTPRTLETRQEALDRLLTLFRPSAILSEKDGKRILVAENRENGRKLVIRSLPGLLPVYDFLCSVRHENLPAVYDVIPCADGGIVLEEFIRGMNAAEVLETGLYTYAGAVKVLRQTGYALQALHEHGFVHRDVKPENL